MKEQQRLPLIFLFSLLFHVLILYIIPEFKVDPLPIEKVYEVQLIKPKPKKVSSSKRKNNKKTSVTPKKEIAKIPKKKINYAGMKRPDIALPTVTTDEKVFIPNSIIENDNTLASAASKERSVDVNRELTEASKLFEKSKGTISDNTGVKGAVFSSSDFFEITSLSNNQRLLLNKPKAPKYALENDTKIILKFYISKNGTPMRIHPLTQSDSEIQKLAIDFVNKLEFKAVNYDTSDAVKITLFFKVR